MCAWVNRIAFAAGLAMAASATSTSAGDRGYGIGRPADEAEIRRFDIDVRPDGTGLPDGRGTAVEGETLYAARCAACHGEFGEGVGRQPALIGDGDALLAERAVKTVGNFWPYAPPLWDYVYRTMPFGDAQSLSVDETYRIVAYVLYLNDLVSEDFVVDRNSLPQIIMPNRNGFVADDRRQEPSHGAPPCLNDCSGKVSVTSRARSLAVTPDTTPAQRR